MKTENIIPTRSPDNHEESKIVYLDTCLPDYFNGFSGNTYGVPIDGTTTYKELLEYLISEIQSQELFSGYPPTPIPESLYPVLLESAKGLFSNVKNMDSVYDSSLDVDSGDCESVYVYF